MRGNDYIIASFIHIPGEKGDNFIMAGKRVEVQLGIKADVAAAKKSIKDLENSLNKLYDKQREHNFGNYGINEAVAGAKKLEQALNRALDVNTGKLDLSKFSQSLAQAGTSLSQLNTQLLNIGPAGQQVFLSLANSIAQAEVPLKKTSRLVQEFSRTLKNTVSYQLSASMFNAVTGALHDAVSYTKNLNGSLNEIRIVTGQSAEQMAQFAKSANAAAKNLSTTTNNYAKASLIFYQQGLSDADVKKRTDAVIKMANVTKESADDVSSYMTAIWNNFDDGSKSLERYADVMTALGAATASSTKEIAAGLEKFASIGKTIGLSYEYATSAVATIVDKTRQSAETVGTGLRTIFSRLQGLSLGETLEDGVDLNKYSAALKTVGVNILDATGNMRDMDAILESLAGKWQNLSNAQKTALAQTVGGVRQYTTLIALMDNWGSMERNLNTANTSTGSLQRQQDIYAESWEAASERSKAALEGLYQTLLNDKGFVKIIDGLTGVTNVVTHLAKALGGLPGILGTVGMVASKVFSNQIQTSIEQSLQKMATWTSQFKNDSFKGALKKIGSGDTKSAEQIKAAQKAAEAQKEYQARKTQMESTKQTDTSSYRAATYANDLLQAKMDLLEVEHKLSSTQKENAQEQITLMGEQQQALLKLKQEKEQMLKDEKRQSVADVRDVLSSVSNMDSGGYVRTSDEQARYILNNKTASVNSLYAMRSQAESAAYQKSMAAQFRGYAQSIDPTDAAAVNQLREGIQQSFGITIDEATTDDVIQEIINKMLQLEGQAEQTEQAIQDVINKSESGAQGNLNLLRDGGSDAGTRRGSIDFEEWQRTGAYKKSKENFGGAINPNGPKGKGDWTKKIASGANQATQAISALTAGISQAQNAIETLGDSGASAGDKIASIGSVASGLTTAFATGGPMGLAAYAIGAVASGVQVLVDKMDNAEENAANAAEEAAAKLQDNYARIRKEYEDTMSTIESYEGASESLNELVVGTDEWKEALLDANEAALKLISNFDLIEGKDYTFGSNGEIVMTKSGDQKIAEGKTQQLNEALSAQNSADIAKAQASIKRMEAQKDVVVREDNGVDLNVVGTAAAGAAIGAALGTFVPVIGNAIGAVGGLIIGGIAGIVTAGVERVAQNHLDEQQKKTIDAITERYKNSNGLMTDKELQDLINNEFAGESEVFRASIMDIVKATVEANGQLEQVLNRAAANVVTSSEIYQSIRDEDVRKDLLARGQTVYNEKYAENKETYESDLEDETKRKEYADSYLESLDLNGAVIKDGTVKEDGSFTYTYLDENNQRQTAEATADMVSNYIITQWTDSQVGTQLGQWAEVFKDLRGGSAEDRAVAAFGGQGLRTATYSEFSALAGSDYEAYFRGLDTETLAALGYTGEDAAEQAIAAFREEVDGEYGIQAAWDQAVSNLNGVFSEDLTGKMSLDTAQAFTNTIEELNKGPLRNAGEILSAGITNAFAEAGVKESDMEALLAQIATIDWSDYDAFEQFQAIMEGMGYSIDGSSESWVNFQKEMRQAGLALPDFSKLKKDLNAVSKIVQDLELGSIVSEEDYNTLVAYNKAWEDFFVLQADGSRKFIGDADAMQGYLEQRLASQKDLLDLYKMASEVEGINNFDWGNAEREGAADEFSDFYENNNEFQAMLTEAGYTQDRIEEILSKAANGDTEELQALFAWIGNAIDPEVIKQTGIDLEQMIASMAKTVDELQALRALGSENGGISDDTYQKSLISMASGYEYCASAIDDYRAALETNNPVLIASAEAALEASITAEQAAEKYNTMYSNAMSGRQDMTLADLKLLQETNEALYNDFMTMTDDEWQQASYEAYSAWLTERMNGYDQDSAEYKALAMEKRQIDEEYYQDLQNRDKEAYDTVIAAWKEKNDNIQEAIEALSIFEDGTTYGEQTFEAIEKLRQSLLATGKTAEEVDQILKNLGKDGEQDDIDAVWAAAQEQARLLLDQATNNKQAEKDIAIDSTSNIIIKDVVNESPKAVETEDGFAPKTTNAEMTVGVGGGEFVPSDNSAVTVDENGNLILKIPSDGTTEDFSVSVDDTNATFDGGVIVQQEDGSWGIQWMTSTGKTYTATIDDTGACFTKGTIVPMGDGTWGIKWVSSSGKTYTAKIDDTAAFFSKGTVSQQSDGSWGITWSDSTGKTYTATLSAQDGFTGSALYYNASDKTWGVNFATKTGETFTASFATNPIEDPNWTKYLEVTENGFQLRMVNRETGESLSFSLDETALTSLANDPNASQFLAYEDGGFRLKTTDASINIVPLLDLEGTGFTLKDGRLTYATEDGTTTITTGEEGTVLRMNADGTSALVNGDSTSGAIPTELLDVMGQENNGLVDGDLDTVFYDENGDIILDASTRGMSAGSGLHTMTALEIAQLYGLEDLVNFDTWFGDGYNFFRDFEEDGGDLLSYMEETTLDNLGPRSPGVQMLLDTAHEVIEAGTERDEDGTVTMTDDAAVISAIVEATGQSKLGNWKTIRDNNYGYLNDAHRSDVMSQIADKSFLDLSMLGVDVSDWEIDAHNALYDQDSAAIQDLFSAETIAAMYDLDGNGAMDQAFQSYFNGMLNEFELDPSAVAAFSEDMIAMISDPEVSEEAKMQGYFVAQGLLMTCRETLGEDNAITQALEAMLASMATTLGIASPSKKTMEMGRWLAKGLQQGATQEDIDLSPLAEKALKSIEDTLKARIESGELSDIISSAFNIDTFDSNTDYWDAVDSYLADRGDVYRDGEKFFSVSTGEEITEDSNPFAYNDIQHQIQTTQDPNNFLQLPSGKLILKTDAEEFLGNNGIQIAEINEGTFQIQDSNGNPIEDRLFTSYENAFGSAIEGAYTEKAMTAYFSSTVDPNFANYMTDKTLTSVQKGMITSIMGDALENATASTGVSYANWDELVNAVGFDTAMGYLNDAYAEHNVQFLNDTEMVWAQINDIMVNAATRQIEIEDEAAQKVVDIWLSAFSAILAARELMISGTSFAEGLDSESMMALIGQYAGTGMSPQQIVAEFFKTSGQNLPEFTMDYNSPESRSFIDSHLRYGANGEVLSTPLKTGPDGKLITAGNADYTAFEAGVTSDLREKITTGMGSASYSNILNNQDIAALVTSGDVEGAMALARLISPDLTPAEIETILAGAVTVDDEGNTVWRNTIDPDAAVDRYIAQQFGEGGLAQAYQDAVAGRVYSDINYRQTMSTSANASAETFIAGQQGKVDLVSKAREAMLNGEDLSYALTPEEQAQLLELTGKADLASVSLDSLDTATMTLTDTMMLCAQQIAIAMGMIERGEADGFSINPETGEVTVTKTTTQTDWDAVDAELEGTGVTRDGENFYHNGRLITANDESAWEDIQGIIAGATTEVVEEVALNGAASTNTSDAVEEAGSAGEVESQNTRLQYAQDAGFGSLEEQDKYIEYLTETSDKMLDIEELKRQGIKTDEEARKIQQKYANQLKKMEKAYERAIDEGDKYVEVLNDANSTAAEQSDAIDNLKQIYGDVLGPMEGVSAEFLKNADNMKLLQKAAQGDEEALNQLQVNYIDALSAMDIAADDHLNALATKVAGYDFGDLEIGASIDDTEFLNDCTALINSCATTADQASAMLSSLGVEAEVKEHTVTIPPNTEVKEVDGMVEIPQLDGTVQRVPAGGQITMSDTGGTYSYFTIEGAKYNGKGVTQGGGGNSHGRRGGGGGGGGRRDPRRANHVKKEDYVERYHEIDNTIDDLADAYERLNGQEDRAWGKDRIANMKEQAKVIEQQVAATEEKIRQAKEYLKLDKEAAEAAGWLFDENGNVMNYDEFMGGQGDKYNSAIDAYNKMSASEQEKIDEKWSKKKNADGEYYSGYEDYLKQTLLDGPKEALEQYEETMELLEDLGMDYDEFLNAWHDNIIGQIQTKLDTTLEVTESQLEYLDHKLSRISDDAYKTAEALTMMAQQMEISSTQFDANKSALNDLLQAYNENWTAESLMNGDISIDDLVSAGMESGDIELLQNIMSGLMDASAQMSKQMVNSIESMANAFDEFNADMDRYISAIEHAQAVTSTYRNIIDLTGRTMSGFNSSMLKSINDATVAQAKANLSANKTKYDTVKVEYEEAKKAYEAAQASYAEGGIDAAALKAAKDTYQAAQDNMNDAQENFLSSWEAALQAAADAFQSNMEAAMRDVGEMMSGHLAGGLAELEDQFAKLSEQDQNYVDDYEKIYQLTKMTRDLTDKIDNTSNVRAQKELLKYQKEINGLLESDQQMSQYDIDYLRKKIDLKMAEIALDEAQNAKSQVTMRRDSEGNYNYVYTADENAVEKAESEYADKLYEMQKANDEYITSLSENMANLSSQMLSEIAAIDTTIYDTEEKYQAEVQRITDHYTNQMAYYNEEMNKVLGNNKTLYEQDWTNFSKYTGYKLSAEENYVTKWNQTVLSQVTGFETQEGFYQNFNEAIFGSDPAHPSSDSLIGKLVTAYVAMRQQINEANKAAGVDTEDLASTILGNIQAATDEAEQAATDITNAAGQIVTQITSIGSAVTTMVNNYSDAMKQMEAETDAMLGVLLDFLAAYGEIGDLDIDPGILAEINRRRQERQNSGNPASMDTGGYTGSWGSEGRLALLHQKELVLNASDTANMLASVGILRQIANVIDLNALASSGGFGHLVAGSIGSHSGTLQQEVHIEANFPNATDKNQIEDAFKDIVNLAAQFANR